MRKRQERERWEQCEQAEKEAQLDAYMASVDIDMTVLEEKAEWEARQARGRLFRKLHVVELVRRSQTKIVECHSLGELHIPNGIELEVCELLRRMTPAAWAGLLPEMRRRIILTFMFAEDGAL